jgi:2-keto-4-pentenoate hydratase/2-oxohepta-3-ene-1,7-dioic acid hydratase in catechol pathway
MTLQPGDVILTGTPEGVVNVNEGDEVVCEIDGIGRLVNHSSATQLLDVRTSTPCASST